MNDMQTLAAVLRERDRLLSLGHLTSR